MYYGNNRVKLKMVITPILNYRRKLLTNIFQIGHIRSSKT